MKSSLLIRLGSALLLLALIASGAWISVAAAADDYSHPSAIAVNSTYADAFLDEYVPGLDLSEVERDYLRLQSGFLFAYNSGIPTSSVETSYEDNLLTVTAYEYTYVSANGVEVVWKPTSATLNGKTEAFTSPPYTVSFSGVAATDGAKVRVDYSSSFTVKAEEIDRLVNLGYNDAPRLEAEIEQKRVEHEEKHAEYLINSAAYNEYLSALALYNEYLSQKRIYDEKYAEYQAYCESKEEYGIARTEYLAYLVAKDKYYSDLAEYTKYLAYAEHNQAKIDAYEKYQENYDTVLAQLNVIKKTNTPVTSLKRTVYGAIMGDTVSTVIDRKGDVVMVLGADPVVVDIAGEATENLRVLLKEFFDLKSTQDQYKYYVTNYEAFRDNFVNLLQALDNLYLVSGVRGAMISEGKHEKYLILVAQLYYVANALSDEPVMSYDGTYCFDGKYVIGKTYSQDKRSIPYEVLENQIFLEDTDSALPLPDGFPIAPEKPEYVTMQEPVMPAPVSEPVMPEEVSEPVAPMPVSKPDAVKKPGREPKPYVAPNEVLSLIDEYNAGRILQRDGYTGSDITIKPTVSVNKTFVGAESVTVRYFDTEYDSNEDSNVLYTVTVDKATLADYLGTVPTKEEDAEYIYTHFGWTDSYGAPVDLTSVSESIDVYPSFMATEKEYDTVWVANGEVFEDNPGLPPLPDLDYHYYDFSGWEKSVDSITSDVTYTAIYDRVLVPTSAGPAKVTVIDGNYVVEPSAVLNRIDISALLDRAEKSGGIIIKTVLGDSLSVSYSETIEMKKAGVASLGFSSVKRDQGGYIYRITAYDAEGREINKQLKVTYITECVVSDASSLFLYTLENSEKKLSRFDLTEGFISFTATVGNSYYARVEYNLTPVPLEAVSIKLYKSIAALGETVAVNIEPMPGIRIDKVYYMGADGVKHTVENGSFKMPAYDVAVGVEYTVLVYKVSFVSDGKTIVSYTCSYGDTVLIPDDPVKASNGKYIYEFSGWSPEVVAVIGDAVYTAMYTATPIEATPPNDMKLTPEVLSLVLLLFVGTGALVLIVVPSVVMTVVMRKRRKKHVFKLGNSKTER